MKKITLVLSLLLVFALSACAVQVVETTNQTPELNMTNQTLAPENGEQEVDQTDDESTEEILDDFFTTIEVTEGEVADLSFIRAIDPDGGPIRYTYGAPFAVDGTWQTRDGDEGSYAIPITANDGFLSTTEQVRVIVLPSNKPPVIDCPTRVVVDEGDFIELDCSIYDEEGDPITVEFFGFMNNFTKQTDFGDAGTYEVLIVASDGNRDSQHTVVVEVQEVNRPPVVQALDSIVVMEGDPVQLDVQAYDPDGDDITIRYPILFDTTGFWQTEVGDAGTYELDIVVSDGEHDVSTPLRIVVNQLNRPPTMDLLGNITVREGDLIDLEVNAQDPDGDDLTITYTGFMTEQTFQTDFGDAGNYTVTIAVSDGMHEISQDVHITIERVRRPPVFIRVD